MDRKSPNFKAFRAVPRPEWQYQFREVMSFLCSPERWAFAGRIPWSADLERLRKDLLHWIWHLAGAPRVGPDGFADVMPVGSVRLPTARNVLIAINKHQRQKTIPASARVGDPNALSFAPIICEIGYKLAGRARGRARAELAQPGTQWMMQSMVQRVINALAAQEKGEIPSASEALAQDALNALTHESNLAEKILDRFQTNSNVGIRILALAKETLGRLGNHPHVRDHLLSSVKELLSAPASSSFQYLRWIEGQGMMANVRPDGIDPIVRPNWVTRADDFPSPVKEAVIPILRQADNSLTVRWKICPLCARPFPLAGTVVKACPVCRRKYKSSLLVHRRLKRVAKDPVAFYVAPPSSKESVWLVIAPGVDAPAALRRIAHAPPTAEDRDALEAALKESEGGSDGPIQEALTQEG